MSLRTLGTSTTTSMNAFVVGANDIIPQDVTSLNNNIRCDPPGLNAWAVMGSNGLVTPQGTNRIRLNAAYLRQGLLVIPKRGMLQLLPGDFVCFDATTGWPFIISGDCAANGAIVHS